MFLCVVLTQFLAAGGKIFLLTPGGLAVPDHKGPDSVPRGQQLPLCIFPAHSLEEPAKQQETGESVQKTHFNGLVLNLFY